MDNLSIPPPLSFPSPPLMTISAPIPTTIPRPVYGVPQYMYHGLSFDLLPPHIQCFLSSHGLDNTADFDTASVSGVRLALTDSLMDAVDGICQAIVHVNVRYNLLHTIYPADHLFLCTLVHVLRRELLPMLERYMAEHLAYADALVWADVAARENGPDALSADEALHYRSLQTQPAVDLVATRLVDLYEWAAAMWMMGWRSDGCTTYLQGQGQPPCPPLVSEVTKEETAPCRIETPPPTFTFGTVHSPPVRPSTPSRDPTSQPITPDSSPRSARRIAASPPASPGPVRTPRGLSASRIQRPKSTANAPVKAKYPPLGMGRTLSLPQRSR
ncbi:hypothetical protein K438DRAFT_1983066 [Mycena galopus ATCC 62051]|nr:hypothetical protein K438DRAFT_1983066 [Mycena galopus ATCC 62051]